MGKIKYLVDIRRFFKESPVVDIHSLKKMMKKKDKRYIHLLVNNLIKRGEINQITRGFYTIHEDPALIVFCFKPSYLGLQNALSIHNLWEQETNPVVVTVKQARQGVRTVFGKNSILRRISPKYFFGFDYMLYGDFYFPVSDIEKTLIDLVYYKLYIEPEVIREFKKRIDKKKLQDYLQRYPLRLRRKVLSMMKLRESA